MAQHFIGEAYLWMEEYDSAFNNLKDDDRYLDLYERTGHKAYDDYIASIKQ